MSHTKKTQTKLTSTLKNLGFKIRKEMMIEISPTENCLERDKEVYIIEKDNISGTLYRQAHIKGEVESSIFKYVCIIKNDKYFGGFYNLTDQELLNQLIEILTENNVILYPNKYL
jgi:hypothetical protein